MADAGTETKESVSSDVEEAVLPESKRADPEAPVPTSTSDSESTEGMEHDEDAHLPYPTDPTPGAVTAMTPKTTAAQAKKESMAPIPVGAWAKLADTDQVEEQGGTPGQIVYVVESPHKQVDGSADGLSPRPHYVQDDALPLTVRTRDEKSQTFLVYPDDLAEWSASGRQAVLPHG